MPYVYRRPHRHRPRPKFVGTKALDIGTVIPYPKTEQPLRTKTGIVASGPMPGGKR